MEAGDGGSRERIVAATLGLLAEGGAEAVSTRAVSAAAGVQAPTIYRLFGDKQGLLDAAASEGFRSYLGRTELREPTGDPVGDLRDGWDFHVELGLANPALYVLMYDRARAGGVSSPAAQAAFDVLADRVAQVARAGRLRVPPERAVALLHAAGHGVALTLIGTPAGARDPMLSPTAREAVLAAITTDAPSSDAQAGPVPAAVALAAGLDDLDDLTVAEKALMRQWLDRIVGGPLSSR